MFVFVGLGDHARFGAGETSATHGRKGWMVETADGRREPHRFLVCASGATSGPATPQIP